MKSGSFQESGAEATPRNSKRRSQERELAESLKYASYIQQAIFPSDTLMNKIIPEHFVFYKPRDIVSGDFYYVAQRNDFIITAVGDCTGHGVPGALMSILGITFLNEIIAHGVFLNAGSVLNQMREHVMEALCQTGEDAEQKDGIDLALCVIDTRKNILNYAGAFNPVYIIRNQQLHEITGDMMPVGVGAEEEKPFTSHFYELSDKDAIYMFTDGFADQFGGNAGRKFKYKPMREMLVKTCHLPMPEQKLRIQQTFDEWKSNLQQLDDVLIFGFRYHAFQ
jgi:serine phosphatase RsbU (regulator of sigma subunit)